MTENPVHGICIQLFIVSVVLLILFTAIFVYGIYDTIKSFKNLTKKLQEIESKKEYRSKLLNFLIKYLSLILLNLIPMLISAFLVYLSLSPQFHFPCSEFKNIITFSPRPF